MTNLYLVDYHLRSQNNGLGTYMSEFVDSLKKQLDISVHIIWVKCPGIGKITKTVDKEIVHYLIPFDLAMEGKVSGSDESVAEYFMGEMMELSNIIIHFNWINHTLFAKVLKHKVDCIAVLTKHSIPWRDFIVSNYSLFLSFDKMLKSRKSNIRIEHPFLVREQEYYSAVDHIICVTEKAKKNLRTMFDFPESRISMIRNGINIGYVKMLSKEKRKLLRRKYGFEENEKIILFAGKITKLKGVVELSQAFEKFVNDNLFPSTRLLLVGEGAHPLVLKNVKHGWPRVTFAGVQERSTLFKLYQIADIGIVPSYIEQCSYTAIEMMHNGLPIIVADVDGLSEIVPANCGLRIPLELGKTKPRMHIKKIVESIVYLLENEKEANEIAARAKQHAKINFDSQKMVAETAAVYKKLSCKS